MLPNVEEVIDLESNNMIIFIAEGEVMDLPGTGRQHQSDYEQEPGHLKDYELESAHLKTLEFNEL